MIKELEKHLSRGIVLDAGCGEGRTLQLLEQRGYQVVGTDLSKQCLLRAQSKNPFLALVSARLEFLPFPSESFDALIAGEVLEHIDNDELAVKEFYRVLRKGGIAIITVPAHPRLWSLDDEWSGHKRRYKKEQLKKLLESNNFQTLSCYYWGFPLLRLYHQFFYSRWLEKKFKGASREISGQEPKKFLEFIFKFVLFPDQLFLGNSRGIGLIGVFYRL